MVYLEENIKISNLNDFIFCPRSIYFHNIYSSFDNSLYYSTFQQKGKHSHQSIDKKNYSSKQDILESIDIYSEEFGIIGKIDLLHIGTKTLIERKRKIVKIYDGYLLQLYAQYFCLVEMGYEVNFLEFYSLVDNKTYKINLPSQQDKEKLKEIILQIRTFNLNDSFSQNINKCKNCIYKGLCDYYKNDE